MMRNVLNNFRRTIKLNYNLTIIKTNINIQTSSFHSTSFYSFSNSTINENELSETENDDDNNNNEDNNEDNNNNNNNNGNGNGNGNNNKQGKKKKVKKQYVKLTEQNIHNAFQILKEGKRAKFDETVDVAIQLNVDPRKQTQAVKGIASLPQGLGKKIRVAVFANGNDIDVAKRAGADFAGSDDLIQMVQNGNIPFDRVIATPDIMSKLSRIGKVLGPRGLMPNPKLGTVTTDVERAVKNAKAGSVTYRVDKQGIIHCGIGKVSFEVNALIDNCRSLMISLFAAKPEAFKGKYVKLMHISSTMGRSIPVDLSTIDPNNPKFMLDEEAIKKLGF